MTTASIVEIGKNVAGKWMTTSVFDVFKPRLNRYLHRYARLRGVRWTRYAKPSKLKEEFSELMEALAEYDVDSSVQNFDHLREETADVMFCILGIAEKAGFDLHDAVEHKILKDKGRNGAK